MLLEPWKFLCGASCIQLSLNVSVRQCPSSVITGRELSRESTWQATTLGGIYTEPWGRMADPPKWPSWPCWSSLTLWGPRQPATRLLQLWASGKWAFLAAHGCGLIRGWTQGTAQKWYIKYNRGNKNWSFSYFFFSWVWYPGFPSLGPAYLSISGSKKSQTVHQFLHFSLLW